MYINILLEGIVKYIVLPSNIILKGTQDRGRGGKRKRRKNEKKEGGRKKGREGGRKGGEKERKDGRTTVARCCFTRFIGQPYYNS